MEFCCIPYKKNSKTVSQNKNQKYYGKTRFVVERFFAWLKCGFHRTTINMRGIVIIILDLFSINSNVLESFTNELKEFFKFFIASAV